MENPPAISNTDSSCRGALGLVLKTTYSGLVPETRREYIFSHDLIAGLNPSRE
jgi:hypothetical protein